MRDAVVDVNCSEYSVPTPDGGIVTDAEQDAAVPAQRCLTDGRVALGMRQHQIARRVGIFNVQVPHVRFAYLIPQRHDLFSENIIHLKVSLRVLY